MQIKLETILAILYANKLEHIVSHAVKIELGLGVPTIIPSTILIQVSKEELKAAGLKPVNDNGYWYNVPVKVLGYNEMLLETPYLVESFDKKSTMWVKNEYTKATLLTSIVE